MKHVFKYVKVDIMSLHDTKMTLTIILSINLDMKNSFEAHVYKQFIQMLT